MTHCVFVEIEDHFHRNIIAIIDIVLYGGNIVSCGLCDIHIHILITSTICFSVTYIAKVEMLQTQRHKSWICLPYPTLERFICHGNWPSP